MKKGLKKNVKNKTAGIVAETTNDVNPNCIEISQSKKIVRSGKVEKTYTVTVRYLKVTEEDATRRRSIVQNIMKKGYLKKRQ